LKFEEGLEEGAEVFLSLSSTSSQTNFGPPMGMREEGSVRGENDESDQ
jgi:hypothetical protein